MTYLWRRLLITAGIAFSVVGVAWMLPGFVRESLKSLIVDNWPEILVVAAGPALFIAARLVGNKRQQSVGFADGSAGWQRPSTVGRGERAPRPTITGDPQGWATVAQVVTSVITAFVAAGALIYTADSVRASRDQVRLSERGQITDRYSRAIEQLGSSVLDVRLGAIYALEGIMRDSPSDHPTVVEVLAAFVRAHTKLTSKALLPKRQPDMPSLTVRPSPDIQAAITVLGRRKSDHDGSWRLDLRESDLRGSNLTDANLSNAILVGVDFSGANLRRAQLAGADLREVGMAGADLALANLADAMMAEANLSNAVLSAANLTRVDLSQSNLRNASFDDANLTWTFFSSAELFERVFFGATLVNANFDGTNLASGQGVDPTQFGCVSSAVGATLPNGLVWPPLARPAICPVS